MTAVGSETTTAFQIESALYGCLNVKELFALTRYNIWFLSDSNGIWTHNHLVRKWILNHIAKLVKWLSCVVSTYLRCNLTWVRIQLLPLKLQISHLFRAWSFIYILYTENTYLLFLAFKWRSVYQNCQNENLDIKELKILSLEYVLTRFGGIPLVSVEANNWFCMDPLCKICRITFLGNCCTTTGWATSILLTLPLPDLQGVGCYE